LTGFVEETGFLLPIILIGACLLLLPPLSRYAGRRITYQQIELAVGGTLLMVITGLVFAAAVMRFFHNPLIWSVDMAQLLLIWLCFFGAARAMRDRAHLGVDLLVRMLGRRYRLALELALSAVFIVFMIRLAWEGYDLTILNKERVFGDSGISYGFVTIAVPVGCILLSAVIVRNAVQALRDPDKHLLVFSRPASVEPHQEI
jgi:TRAP-type C4-dicarboxylate transport system permease small subunit